MRVTVKHLKRTYAKGRTYYYHRRTGERLGAFKGRLRAVPASVVSRCIEINAGLGRSPRATEGTLADLIASYKAGPDFLSLTAETRRQYRMRVDWLSEHYGDHLVHEITTEDVLAVRDEWADRPATADLFSATFSILFRHAITHRSRYGGITFNPATREAGVRQLYKADGWKPWPDDLIAHFRSEAVPAYVTDIIELALYTGQRVSDLVLMKWSDIRDGGVHVTQQKTGARLWVPIHPDLAPRLDQIRERQQRAPVQSLFILTGAGGKSIATSTVRQAIARHMPSGLTDRYVLHGLRKNATIALLESGCSVDEVKAITGHESHAMVSHYGKGVQQAELARNAVTKWHASGTRNAEKVANFPGKWKTGNKGECND